MEVTPAQLEELRDSILASFPMTEPPSEDDITSHPCEECAAVTSAFAGVRWWSADPALIDDSFDDLPLFTAHAYRYYFPAFLLRALETFEPDNLVTQFSLFDLSGDASDDLYRKRIEQFTSEQRAVIISFLRYVCDDARLTAFMATPLLRYATCGWLTTPYKQSLDASSGSSNTVMRDE